MNTNPNHIEVPEGGFQNFGEFERLYPGMAEKIKEQMYGRRPPAFLESGS
jgi:hypothetical protein